jgi:fatty-acyl-CoA synthase
VSNHNFGDVVDAVEAVIDPQALAYAHGDRLIRWGEASQRSNRLARAFLAAAQTGDKVAHYMRNHHAYMETTFASFKARLAHVNINYRYRPAEVAYIIENSDAAIVVYGAEFRETVAEIRAQLPLVKLWVEVADGTPVADFAQDFETLASTGDGSPLGITRSPDDMFLLYTGGTTGMPKGVMWPQGQLREVQLLGARAEGLVRETLEDVQDAIRTNGSGPAFLPACPLMHGTGFFTAISAILGGGAIITLPGHSFDPHALWKTAEMYKAGIIAIVGDTFAKPMLRALEEKPGAYDLSAIAIIVSSGVMWSREVKLAMLDHIPQVALTDSFGSSEAVGFGSSITTRDGETQTARFVIGPRCKVFDEQDREVAPGSGQSGIIGIGEPIPLGYYKDPEKTEKTFRTINGVRYAMPGDHCIVEADGSLTLLGRGSATINTGGEKVFPEEVEEVLKLHPQVEDTLVVGVPDDRWGQAVVAVVMTPDGGEPDEAAIRDHVRATLAPYKVPKHVWSAGSTPLRAPNGKADYKAATAVALAALGKAG